MTEVDVVVLPALVSVSQAFTARLPAQRTIDLITRIESGVPFAEIVQSQPFRVIAFRKLMADYPGYDTTALWLHAYDVEVDVVEADPTNGSGPTLTLPSAPTTTVSPTTSTG